MDQVAALVDELENSDWALVLETPGFVLQYGDVLLWTQRPPADK